MDIAMQTKYYGIDQLLGMFAFKRSVASSARDLLAKLEGQVRTKVLGTPYTNIFLIYLFCFPRWELARPTAG